MEQRNLEKELFDMVYQWGKVGVVTDEKSNAFQDLIREIETVAVNDFQRHGTT
jgi:hypothetical protein